MLERITKCVYLDFEAISYIDNANRLRVQLHGPPGNLTANATD